MTTTAGRGWWRWAGGALLAGSPALLAVTDGMAAVLVLDDSSLKPLLDPAKDRLVLLSKLSARGSGVDVGDPVVMRCASNPPSFAVTQQSHDNEWPAGHFFHEPKMKGTRGSMQARQLGRLVVPGSW